mmetsp:Transcript_15826/g.36640  ORF Transcript_15826/g.36640 Transcript_15826/m.36640 type:complete len:107 (-) Transcript_15826:102-422(-)
MHENQRKPTKGVARALVLAVGKGRKRLASEVVDCKPIAVILITRFSAQDPTLISIYFYPLRQMVTNLFLLLHLSLLSIKMMMVHQDYQLAPKSTSSLITPSKEEKS